MKKIVICIMCFIMLITNNVLAHNVSEDDLLVSNNTVEYLTRFNLTIDTNGIVYYPFIYQKNNEWFNERVIGNAKCNEGYLYSKNLNTGVIKQLVSVPVGVFRENQTGVYFIYRNSIYYVDYNGISIDIIYNSSAQLQQNLLERYDDELYFVEANKIVKYNIENKRKTVLADAGVTTMLFVKSANEIVYSSSEKHYYVNNKSNIKRMIDDVEFVRNFI